MRIQHLRIDLSLARIPMLRSGAYGSVGAGTIAGIDMPAPEIDPRPVHRNGAHQYSEALYFFFLVPRSPSCVAPGGLFFRCAVWGLACF